MVEIKNERTKVSRNRRTSLLVYEQIASIVTEKVFLYFGGTS